jgi:30S ribosomal protein S31
MGKGDRKTTKGKRNISSYGKSRPHEATRAAGIANAPAVKKTATKSATKTARKTVAKKAAAK